MGRLVVATCASKGREKAESPATARIAKAVGSLWRRAPLLALLIAWMLLGLVVVPLSAEFWALGFLALIGFQFVVTIRNRARR